MNTIAKTIITLVMVTILGVISLMTILEAGAGFSLGEIILAIAPMGLALGTIKTLWVESRSSSDEGQYEKAKRNSSHSNFDLLMEMMDEEEREAFKETLKRRVLNQMSSSMDGELPADSETLAALLDEDAQQAQYH